MLTYCAGSRSVALTSGEVPGSTTAGDTMSDSQSRLSADQIRFLSAPIFGPALRQDAKAAKGNVYIPGNFVLAQLNTAFCFDGWSFAVTRTERVHMEKYTKDGKDQFRALYVVEGVLTVRCQDGSTFSRSGIGCDEKTSSNMKDVISLATKAALTDAIKNAAITIGRQFGLDTVRAGKTAEGMVINWRANASGERPRPPTFAGLSTQLDTDPPDDEAENVTEDGVTFNSRTGEVVQDNRPADSAGRPQERQEHRREPAPSQSSSAPSPNAQSRHEQGGGNGDRRQEQAAQPSSADPSQSSPTAVPYDRAALVTACREAFRAAGATKSQAVFQRIAQDHGFAGAMPAIGRPQDAGGPTVAFLDAYLAELRKAVG